MGPDAFQLPIPTWQVCVLAFTHQPLMYTFQHRLPFDWKNPTGFFVAVLLQLRIVSIPLCFVRTLLLLAAGSLLFSLSIAEDKECDLNAINESIRAEQPRELILDQITEFIKSTNIKRLVSYFAEVYQIPIILLFFGCTACTCLAMLMIQIDLNQVIQEPADLSKIIPTEIVGVVHLESNSISFSASSSRMKTIQ